MWFRAKKRLRFFIIAPLLALLLLPAAVFAHHISSSASTWELGKTSAKVDFQYPLADIAILVSPESVRKSETYVQIIRPVDDELKNSMTAMLNQAIPSRIKLKGCDYKGELGVLYGGGTVKIHGELTCAPGYLDDLRLEDKFLVAVNKLHVSIASLAVGEERFKCLFRSGMHDCAPRSKKSAGPVAVPWKEMMGGGKVLAFHGWEQWLFVFILLVFASNRGAFFKYLGVFAAGNGAATLALLVGRLPEPSLVRLLVPAAIIAGALSAAARRMEWRGWMWGASGAAAAALVFLSLAGVFALSPAATVAMALLGYGLISISVQERSSEGTGDSGELSGYIFAALFGLLHGFTLADGLRNYSTLGAGGLAASLGFDASDWLTHLGMAAVATTLAALSFKYIKSGRWRAFIAVAAGAVALFWLLQRGVTLTGDVFDYKKSAEVLKNTISAAHISPRVMIMALMLAVILGGLHALTPGHGKTIVAAYLVGTKGKVRDALILGLIVTVTHTSSVLLLGVIALVASKTILPGELAPYLGAFSGFIIVIMGVVMLYSRYSNWRKTGQAYAEHSHGGHSHSHHRHDHEHGQEHDHEHAHGHNHVAGSSQSGGGGVRLRDLVALGVSGGLVPCPDAFVVLLLAITINRIGLGLIILLAFSAGLAATLIAVGITMVKARPLFERYGGGGNFVKAYLPIGSAVLVTVIGVIITAQSLLRI